MTYTINGKQYTESDINKRCAELMEPKASGYRYVQVLENHTPWDDILEIGITTNCCVIKYLTISEPNMDMWSMYDPCNSPIHAWPIIDKCWDELFKPIFFKNVQGFERRESRWNCIIIKYNCTKLVAACICLIELNE
jgi:hypothetical protein